MKFNRAVQGVSDQSHPLLPSYRAQSSSLPWGRLQKETETSSPLPVHLQTVRSFWSLTAPIQYWLEVSLLNKDEVYLFKNVCWKHTYYTMNIEDFFVYTIFVVTVYFMLIEIYTRKHINGEKLYTRFNLFCNYHSK